jgi:hypothetical protein
MTKNNYVKITTPPFVLSFPVLTEPKPDMYGNPPLKYSVKMMWSKDISGADLEKFNAMQAAIQKAAKEAFGDKDGRIPKSLKLPIRDGDEAESTYSHGYWTANAKTQRKPGVVDQTCRLMTDDDVNEKLYSGAICRATVLISTFEAKGQKGVNLFLQNIQLLGAGTKIGGGARDPGSDFEATETSEAAADFG